MQPNTEPLDAAEIMGLDKEYVMGTYARQPVLFTRGEGARLWDSEGRCYLDFLAGIAVVQVGHCHPKVAGAIARQAHSLMHVSNLFHNPLQAKLAERLCSLTDMEKVFFCNSGAEANEAALKIARKYGRARHGEECYEIITFTGSFHGRTFGALSATAQPKYQASFAPMVPGFHYAPLNDLEAVRSLVSERTCAIMIEPIQGEGGIHPCTPEFLSGLRALCDEHDMLLILDEVQCGTGRTGRFLASQTLGVTGDVVTLAKGVADGFPMGACLARGEAGRTLVPGDHGSTFAGQPLACSAALATLDVLQEERLMEQALKVGSFFKAALLQLQEEQPGRIAEVRGMGLMLALQFVQPEAKAVLASLMEQGVIANALGDTALRFVPPLVVTESDCAQVVEALRNALNGHKAPAAAAPALRIEPADHSPEALRRSVQEDKTGWRGRSCLSLLDLSSEQVRAVLDLAAGLKRYDLARRSSLYWEYPRTLAMLFEKPSLRTRVSFEAAMAHLKGHAIYLAPGDVGLGVREAVPDVAAALSRWVDIVSARVFKHETVEELDRNSTIPVINALSDREHPIQAFADLLTLQEQRGPLGNRLKLAYLGDGNNVLHALFIACARMGVHCSAACPEGYDPDACYLEEAQKIGQTTGAKIELVRSPKEAAQGADALYTDVWASMGQEEEKEERAKIFAPYQLSEALFAQARPGAVALHCLPAHRGEEITAEVMALHKNSILEQAENRLHTQKALLMLILGL